MPKLSLSYLPSWLANRRIIWLITKNILIEYIEKKKQQQNEIIKETSAKVKTKNETIQQLFLTEWFQEPEELDLFTTLRQNEKKNFFLPR